MSDMLSPVGNAFALAYFDFDHGSYLTDYSRVLQKQLPSEFHVAFTESNYLAIRDVIEERFAVWRANPQASSSVSPNER